MRVSKVEGDVGTGTGIGRSKVADTSLPVHTTFLLQNNHTIPLPHHCLTFIPADFILPQ